MLEAVKIIRITFTVNKPRNVKVQEKVVENPNTFVWQSQVLSTLYQTGRSFLASFSATTLYQYIAAASLTYLSPPFPF